MKKLSQKKRNPTLSSIITLSDMIDSYKGVMAKRGIDTSNETHYYSMIVKLSLN